MQGSFRIHILISWVILAALVGSPFAERVHTVNAKIDLLASANLQNDMFLAYRAYPSIGLNSIGSRSSVKLSYSVGDRFESHTFRSVLNTQFTRNLQLKLSESLAISSDLTTFNLFRGILFTPEGNFLDYETITVRRTYTNRASVTLEYALSPNSALSGGLGHFWQKFQENEPSLTNQLSDENSFNGNLRYIQTIDPRTRWDLGYSVFQYDFQEVENSRTHHVRVDLSHKISPTVSLNLGTGPSYTEASSGQAGFLSYKNGSVSISKSLEDTLLSLSYWRRSGTSTGAGSLSDAWTLDLRFSRPLGRRTTIRGRVSLYDAQGRLDNPVDTRGVTASLLCDFLLQNNWVVVLGGRYQTQGVNNTFDLERKQAFISLRFALPQLLRF
jgi:hypothetical protein